MFSANATPDMISITDTYKAIHSPFTSAGTNRLQRTDNNTIFQACFWNTFAGASYSSTALIISGGEFTLTIGYMSL